MQKVEEGKKSQADIARDFNVDPAVISRLKKNTEKLKGKLAKASGDILQRKRLREGKFLDVDEKVFAWMKYMRELLCNKAASQQNNDPASSDEICERDEYPTA